jgi:fructokinase
MSRVSTSSVSSDSETESQTEGAGEGSRLIQVGVDFGGTKIEAAALDAHGNFLARVRAPNPGTYDAAIRTVCELIDAVESQAGGRGTIGVGGPGSISPRTGVMRNANSTYLNGRRFREDLAAALGRDVRLANDANCLALSEVVDGAAVGSQVAFAVILGTGCGGGLVVNGHLVEGANGVGGEWGHMPLPWPSASELDATQCWCGQRGCLETWVSGTGLQRDFLQATGRQLDGESIIQAVRAGDLQAQTAFDQYVSRLGRALAVIVNVLDPDTFVLGGGMSNVTELYERLPQIVRSYVFSDSWEAKIVPAQWGDSSGVRGAARLWLM